MTRKYNFSAGPAMLPEAVLQRAAAEMLDWNSSGMSVMEMSHRSAEFESIIVQAQADLRELLLIPDQYQVLFIATGATALNALIPMNLLGRHNQNPLIDFVHTGVWSGKSLTEAKKYAQVHIAASSEKDQFNTIPPFETWHLSPDAAYVHVCTNETINGTEYHFTPDTGQVPLVADMSSHILSREIDVSKYGVIFACAQKNMGLPGLTIAIVRPDLIGHAHPFCPSVFDWKNLAENNSLFNTPPTYSIYICGLVLEWLKKQGGIGVMEQKNTEKARLLYAYIDASDFYRNDVMRNSRSRMNIPFFLPEEALNDSFLAGAAENGILQLAGHRLLGGMRASLYNAMPIEGVQILIAYMRDFERTA